MSYCTLQMQLPNGQYIAWTGYDEWGVVTSPDSHDMNMAGVQDSIRFTSYTKDRVLGLYYAQNRWYDATTRRFTAVDPIKDGDNWYIYVENNPVNWVDPNGLSPLTRVKEVQMNLEFGVSPENVVRSAVNARTASTVSRQYAIDNDILRPEVNVVFEAEFGITTVGDEPRMVPDTWNNEVDAYRHFLWNALNAREMGASQAALTTNIHEVATLRDEWVIHPPTPENPVIVTRMNQETLMDIHNNMVGVQLGARADLRHMSPEELFAYAMRNNMLIVDVHDVPSRFGISNSYFTTDDWTVIVFWNISGYEMRIISAIPVFEPVNIRCPI